MKNIFVAFIAAISAIASFAQSKYDPKEAFNPQFYPYPGSSIRSASGEPGSAYWQNRADYAIECSLDSSKHLVSAVVTITYSNNSPDNLKFLWLQVDQNIYKKDSRGSATTTEAGGRWANSGFTDGEEIESISVEQNGKKYTAKYSITDTRMQVWLNDVLKANGGQVKITIAYKFLVAEYGTDRMGRLLTKNGWIYEVAQWFPRMCVYDDIQGWNTLPYLGAGEFYLEYGDVSFNVTAPSGILVVGSGELQNPEECFTAEEFKKYEEAKNSDKTIVIRSEKDIKTKKINNTNPTTTWKFKINNARDVAWAASKAFILDGAKINLPSAKKCLALSAYPVESADERKNADWRRSTEMVKGSIEHYSSKWFEFPYPVATNVAGIVGGMEYPGIVFCGYEAVGIDLWSVTDHEFGHTWFPMIVGSNERKYAWMDEGFNTFINGISSAAFNKGEFKEEDQLDSPNAEATISNTFNDKLEGLFTMPDVIQQHNLGLMAYYKPALMLEVLRNAVLGPDRFDAAFREYINRWAFKHPTPWDFFHSMENVSGEDLGWFWRGWVLNNWKIDIAVKRVFYVDDIVKNGAEIQIENLEKMPMPIEVLIKEANGKTHTVSLPVEIWQRNAEWIFTIPSSSEIKEVILDPNNKLPDVNRKNNTLKKAF